MIPTIDRDDHKKRQTLSEFRRCLDELQSGRARRLLASGWAFSDVAADCALTLSELQSALDLPQWRGLPANDWPDNGGQR